MRSYLVAAAVWGILASVSSARADGLILKLPADGTWAVYKAEGYKTRGDQSKEHVSGWFRISSVGKKTEQGEPCRWIELENSYKTDAGERRWTEKLLIPEKYLTAGQAPAEHIVRGYFQFDPLPQEGKPAPLPKLDGKPHTRGAAYYLCGPSADADELAPAPVACKFGEPLCPGRKGTSLVKLQNGPQTAEVSCAIEVRTHDEAPFGVVMFQHAITGPDGREAMMKLVLDDFGPTARSRLATAE
jgi:hypothetical protein